MEQDEIGKAAKECIDNNGLWNDFFLKEKLYPGDIRNNAEMVFKAGVEFAQSKMYSEEDMKKAFDSSREFNSLDGVVDVHIVLPMGGDMRDLQPLYPTFTDYLKTVKNK